MTSVGVVSTYFDKHKDKVYAGIMASTSMGVLIGPVLMEYLIDMTSYQTGILIGAAAYLLIFPAALIYRGTFRPRNDEDKSIVTSYNNKAIMSDSSHSLSSINHTPPCERKTCSSNVDNIYTVAIESDIDKRQDNIDINFKSNETQQKNVSIGKKLRSKLQANLAVLKDALFIFYMVYFMAISLGENTYYSLAVDYSVSTRNILTLKEASLAMSVTGICVLAGSVVLIFLSHWSIDRQVFGIVTSTLLSLSLLAMPLVESPAGMFAISVVFGLMDGMFVSGISSLIQYQFGHNEQFLTRFSYLMLMVGVGSVIGPIGAGHLGNTVGMENSFYFLGGVSLCGSISYAIYVIFIKIKNQI
ncbi:uncharacterized protein [Watersipora subatra]|uniref:uncharacterized protein n=1 Tax=Watersipora subatra TaxID=2589382 RepID=UPI00355C8537